MTKEGRLARGKLNYEAKRFLDNPETLEYIETLPESKKPETPEAPEKEKPSEPETKSEEED